MNAGEIGQATLSPSASALWFLVDSISRFGFVLVPVIACIIAALWVRRVVSIGSVLCFGGASVALASNLTRYFVLSVQSINLGVMQPNEVQSVLIWFIYIHGYGIGLLLFSISVLWHFYSLPRPPASAR